MPANTQYVKLIADFISKEIALAVLREAGEQEIDGKPSSNLRQILRYAVHWFVLSLQMKFDFSPQS